MDTKEIKWLSNLPKGHLDPETGLPQLPEGYEWQVLRGEGANRSTVDVYRNVAYYVRIVQNYVRTNVTTEEIITTKKKFFGGTVEIKTGEFVTKTEEVPEKLTVTTGIIGRVYTAEENAFYESRKNEFSYGSSPFSSSFALELTKENILTAARRVLGTYVRDAMENNRLWEIEKSLLGSYPPKKLTDVTKVDV